MVMAEPQSTNHVVVKEEVEEEAPEALLTPTVELKVEHERFAFVDGGDGDANGRVDEDEGVDPLALPDDEDHIDIKHGMPEVVPSMEITQMTGDDSSFLGQAPEEMEPIIVPFPNQYRPAQANGGIRLKNMNSLMGSSSRQNMSAALMNANKKGFHTCIMAGVHSTDFGGQGQPGGVKVKRSKKCLNDAEVDQITALTRDGMRSVDIAKVLGRDHRTIKRFLVTGEKPERVHSGNKRKLTEAQERSLCQVLERNPHLSSREVFEAANVPLLSRTQRNVVLHEIGKTRSRLAGSPLTTQQKVNRLKWATRNVNTDFKNVLFTGAVSLALDEGPAGWRVGWINHRKDSDEALNIWAGIVGDKLVGPYRVPDCIRLNSPEYCEFLEAHLMPWLTGQPEELRDSLVFQQDSVRNLTFKYTERWLRKNGFRGKILMTWPPNSPDLNCIGNLWSAIRKDLAVEGSKRKHYENKDELWNAIKSTCQEYDAAIIKKMTETMSQRVALVINQNGGRVSI